MPGVAESSLGQRLQQKINFKGQHLQQKINFKSHIRVYVQNSVPNSVYVPNSATLHPTIH